MSFNENINATLIKMNIIINSMKIYSLCRSKQEIGNDPVLETCS